MEIKGITTKSSTGEINGHEWLEEMFRKVDCSFTQLGVVVLKLTIIVNQIYSLIEENGVYCSDILGTNRVQRMI